MGSEPAFRFLTGSLQLTYLKPTPLGPEIEIRGSVRELKERKVVIDSRVRVNGVDTARGEVVAILMPENFGQ